MPSFFVDIEYVTPEIHRILEQLRAHPGVKIIPQQAQSAWDKALVDGAVGVDVFFVELDARIDKWSDANG